jgi:glycyl-tRNA synthetase beta chain
MPHFIAVANIDEDRTGKIKSGNERVLKARLDDAHFYWEQDLKDGLDAMAGRLDNVIWQEQLGTLMEKSRRLGDLSKTISEMAGLSSADLAVRAAYLCKADLTSLMVREKEFSSLQGLMGKEYAAKASEPSEVSEAIFEHYLPRYAGDILPSTPTGTALALADKLDTLVGCFGIELIPTGSQDPYALRRQATGLVRILMEKGIHLSVTKAISASYGLYTGCLRVPDSVLTEQLLQFLGQRVETLLVESGERRDMVAAVVAVGIDDPALLTKRLSAVKEFEKDERFTTLVTAFKRAYNITKGEQEADVDVGLFEEDAERDLYGTCRKILKEFNSRIYEQDFAKALALLLELSAPIDVFFDKVMVMHENPDLRRNRLNLLGWITHHFLTIANFSKMEVG